MTDYEVLKQDTLKMEQAIDTYRHEIVAGLSLLDDRYAVSIFKELDRMQKSMRMIKGIVNSPKTE